MVADIHGNSLALEAVLNDASGLAVEKWWALGDLALFGPRPVEVMEILDGLPGIEYLSGNTDRYVVTAQQPAPHRDAATSAGNPELVARYATVAGAIGWSRGALAQGGMLDRLRRLPATVETTLPDGSRLLGLHASLARDDGDGINNAASDESLLDLLGECDAPVVVGGHTHDPTDRVVGRIRALNPGSVGLPRRAGEARWLVIDADEDGIEVDLRAVPYDVEGVVRDLHDRGYPNASYLAEVLTGARVMGE